MSNINLAYYREACREKLHDEDSNNYTWKTDQLDRCIYDAIREASRKIPYVQKSVLTLTAASKEIDLSDITVDSVEDVNLAKDIMRIVEIEYPVDQDPPILRAWRWRTNSIIRLDMSTTPAVGDEVDIYCALFHSVTTDTSTLTVVLEDIVLHGAVSNALINWATEKTNSVLLGGTDAASKIYTIGITGWLTFHSMLNENKPVKQSKPRRWS